MHVIAPRPDPFTYTDRDASSMLVPTAGHAEDRDVKLKDRVCLITGATSGIGAATARAFATEGAALALTGRDPERGQEVVAACASAGAADAFFAPAEVTDAEDVDAVDARRYRAMAGSMCCSTTRAPLIPGAS